MPAFRMVIELAGTMEMDSIEDLDPDKDDDSVELIIRHDGNQIREETDYETAHQVLNKLEEMGITNHEYLEDYEYSSE